MNTTKPLTDTEANEIGGAIQELVTLATKTIIEKDDAARKRALTSYLQEKMVLHCREFLSAWFVLEKEYKPFLSAQANVMGNVFQIIQTRARIMQDQEDNAKQPTADTSPDAAPAPANVVQLNVTK
jgi:hypothetical protein